MEEELKKQVREMHQQCLEEYSKEMYNESKNSDLPIKLLNQTLLGLPDYNNCLSLTLLTNNLIPKLSYIGLVEGSNIDLPKERLTQAYSIIKQFSTVIDEYIKEFEIII